MMKESKFVNILCSLLLGMVAGTFILFAIALFGGEIALNRTRLTLTTDSAEKLYDASPLTADGWEVSGELNPGHTATVEITGSRTNAGESENKATLTILDEAGEDVTSEYKIKYEFGLLTVSPRSLIVSSADASKTFDGEPLVAADYVISEDCDGLLLGHKAQVTVTGSIVDVGATANTISSVLILDTQDNDVTANYRIRLREGLLMVKDVNGNLPGNSSGGVIMDGESTLLPSEGNENFVLYKVFAETSGYLYLKSQSYGDYTGTGWAAAPVYTELLENTYSAYYLTSSALNAAGRRAKTLRIQSFCGVYGLPYYATLGSGITQTNDTLFSGDTSELYEISYYDMVKNLSELYLPSQYESAYRQFVYGNYLSIDNESLAYMNELIQNEGFSVSDPDIINAVAKYIQKSAVYSLDFDENLEKESNIAIAFLRDYKEGVCRHYASAAVLLYRALGIPARYTVGALAETKENQWTDVLAKNAHAWVEVYVNNVGWIQVEVTGTAADTNTAVLKPADAYYRYDGKEHTAPSVLAGFEAYALRGYTYEAKVSGSRTKLGVTETEITELRIFNSVGKDVTDKFDIELEKGILQIYTDDIVLESLSETVTYGSFSATPTIFVDDSGLNELLTVIVTRDTDVGVGRNLNKFEVKLLDENGEDVTEHYRITRNYGELTVNPLQITLKAGDATKVYDGEALTCGDIELTEGTLVKGHTLQSIEIVGSQKLVGRSENVITYVAIHDQNGRNVTENYALTLLPGTLKVTMR